MGLMDILRLTSWVRASAKSTILSQICLSAVDNEHNVLVYSGELTDKRFTRWLIQQAAGKSYIEELKKDDNTFWIVPKETQQRIAKWISNRLFVYNNSYGYECNSLM